MKRPALPTVPADRVIRPATPEPPLGVVAWNMNTSCNYRCTYCTQRFLDDRTRWAADVPRFLDGFAQLARTTSARWEVKLSGGEPFLHPHFTDVVHGLRERGLLIGVVTNFSASDERIDAFLDAAGDALTVLSCSLHLEYAAPDAFVAKCVRAQARMRSGSLVVTCVATRAFLPRLRALHAQFSGAGLTFKVQPEKQDRAVIDYSDDEASELVQLGGHNGTGKIKHDFLGQPCWAGARSLIVDDRGDVFRCYPARRHRTERLGNLLDGSFAPYDGPTPCRYSYCNCTVPIARGMMPS